MEKKSKIVVAQIIGKWLGGGVESVIMNYYRFIDRSKIQFDFICDEDSTDIPYEEIERLGGRVYLVSPYQNLFKYLKDLKIIFKKNNYDIVHSNLNSLSVFPLLVAKITGVPVRIAHNHSTSNKKEWKKNILKNILKPFSRIFATDYFACSELAARWLFGNAFFKTGKVTIINNAIDFNKFKYDESLRKIKRKELNVDEDTIVFGNIGRFVKQKNHDFLIDVFYEIHKEIKNSKLILIGQGPLQEKIIDKVKLLCLENDVEFLGQRVDVNELYQAMDVFLFPSLYEGLGMVLIEAQISGLPCVASTEVPNVAKISSNFKFLSLDDSLDKWKTECIDLIGICDRKNEITNRTYDIESEVKKLEMIYLRLGGAL